MRPVQFILKMINRVSGPGRKIEGALARIRGAAGRTRKAMGGVGRLFSSLGFQLAGVSFAALGGYMIRSASDAQEMRNRFSTIFGSMSSDVRSRLDEIAEETGRTSEGLEKYAARFGGFFTGLGGFADNEILDLSTSLTGLTSDFASFYNMSEEDVMSNLVSGLKGNHEALDRFDVSLTAATLDQELLNMGIAGGIKEATEQQKTLARLNFILDRTKKAHGDAARTSTDFANNFRNLKERGVLLAQTYGAKLLPIVNKVVSMLIVASDWLLEQSDRTQILLGSVVALGVGLLPLIGFLSTIGFKFTFLSSIFTKFIPMIFKFARGFLVATGPIGWVITAISILVPALIWAYNNVDWFRSAVDKLFGVLKNLPNALGELYRSFVARIGELLSYLSELPALMAQRGRDAVSGFIGGIRERLGAVQNVASEMGENFMTRFNNFFQMNSPSKLLEHSGVNIVKGRDKGVRKEEARSNVMSSLLKAPSASAGSNASATPAIDITINGGGDAKEVAREVRKVLLELFEDMNRGSGVASI